ncbi:hypothetical protein OHB39_25120 [Streptomyces sp. NBC_00047]|uniref:hypothetical protein n=1 Tax=Streptomyces sp. NBC_00047 TaxID=2975627 RepID=UPI002251C85A|nr:hypothetical protein [Streptomyces sp. NBC_00047]MCX5610819.1 hypothetical protein [Streptomyces sp. NBC_00047]
MRRPGALWIPAEHDFWIVRIPFVEQALNGLLKGSLRKLIDENILIRSSVECPGLWQQFQLRLRVQRQNELGKPIPLVSVKGGLCHHGNQTLGRRSPFECIGEFNYISHPNGLKTAVAPGLNLNRKPLVARWRHRIA